MTTNRAAIKTQAKQCIRGTKPSPIIMALIVTVMSYVIFTLSAQLMSPPELEAWAMANLQEALESGQLETWDDAFLFFSEMEMIVQNRIGFTANILNVALSLILLILNVGYIIFSLNAVRHLPVCYGNLLDGFGIFFRVILLEVLTGIFVFLWGLLFFVPGIIAAYRYRQALYLLLDHPDWTASRCIKESKVLMQGRKMELFVLDLSFLGWTLLASIPLVNLWVIPYKELTYAGYYNAISGQTRSE